MKATLRIAIASKLISDHGRGWRLPRLASAVALGSLMFLIPLHTSAMAEDFSGLQWATRTIHLQQAWQIVPGRGAGVRVCDVDSGVMLDHPDLHDAIVGGTNTADPASPQAYTDDAGHGTYTAGIMVARGKAIWGVAPGASLLVAKALYQGNGDATTVSAAVLWCIERGAAVVNVSLGVGATRWDSFREAIDFGCRQGVDFAVAAGNDGGPNQVIDPANVQSPCLIAVNASDQQDQRARFSNYFENKRTVTAPGQAIISDWTNGGVTLGSGTSASAPFVAGVMALLRSQGADAQTAVRMILRSARHPHGARFIHGQNDQLGYGILDAGAACGMYHTLTATGSA